ncbi:WhiB family transcriptional regulator [Rhodococcus sp. NPDC060176]|uniref:WhiB family transcriptional regulator n=1 Tax=Rhodococcus sp. NPDC060176 TaxID=3347062 RepID=UPI003646BA49
MTVHQLSLTETEEHFQMPGMWISIGLCAQTDPELFFPETYSSAATNMAKRICWKCPVRDACREHAVMTTEPHGIWGGTTPYERRKIRVADQAKSISCSRDLASTC